MMAKIDLPGTTLKDKRQWPKWYGELRVQCDLIGSWHFVNPDAPDVSSSLAFTAQKPSKATLRTERDRTNTEAYEQRQSEWRTADPTTRGPQPVRPTNTTDADVASEYKEELEAFSTDYKLFILTNPMISSTWKFIERTVDPLYWGTITRKLQKEDRLSLQNVVRSLREKLAPKDFEVINTIRADYRRVLELAKTSKMSQMTWYEQWNKAYVEAESWELESVTGQLASLDFLDAVSARLAPEWATRKKQDMIEGSEWHTIEELGHMFFNLAQAAIEQRSDHSSRITPSVFATLGGISGQSNSNSQSTRHRCPCRSGEHMWEPTDCRLLQEAITGKVAKDRQPTEAHRIKATLIRLYQPEHARLKTELAKKWTIPAKPRDESSTRDSKRGKRTANTKAPGSMIEAIIDPKLLEGISNTVGVYATLNFGKHPLSDSILFDNCGATHLVNDVQMLDPGTFVKATSIDEVECGTSSLPVIGRGRWTLKGMINGASNDKPADLTLKDVAVIPGFHTNIVSEARLRTMGIWYLGLDCSLNFGTSLTESFKLKILERRYNLVFLKYSPIEASFVYSEVPKPVKTNVPSVTLMFSTITADPGSKGALRLYTKRSVHKHESPRSDSADIWHLRSGHLGPKALEAMVKNTRNVRISGIPRKACTTCAITHAKKVIARGSSDNVSPRPFWRVQWDLFDFPSGVAMDGSSWLLVIKDEYSGKLFGKPLRNKDHLAVYSAVRQLESWVRRQYGLAICKLKHDRDTSVIPIQGVSQYMLWAQENGIDLELSPTYTSESNGGAERAGQEVITRSIKMRESSNLPASLWMEVALSAIFLYNMSPLEAKGLHSPNEILLSWFQNYFRWYDPLVLKQATIDLRPDWNGIYVYGCRAYPMIKEREAGRSKRLFKIKPRGHIGYLVGYVASNIYRIWVPQLARIIVTRNVTFDESTFYNKPRELAVGQPLELLTRLVDQLIIENDQISAHESIALWETANFDDETDIPLQDHPSNPDPVLHLVKPVEQDVSIDRTIGLITPDPTPEPSLPAPAPSSQGSGEQGEQRVIRRTIPQVIIPSYKPPRGEAAHPTEQRRLPGSSSESQLNLSGSVNQSDEQGVLLRGALPEASRSLPPRTRQGSPPPPAPRRSSRIKALNSTTKRSEGSSDRSGEPPNRVFAFRTLDTFTQALDWSYEDMNRQLDHFYSTFWTVQDELGVSGAEIVHQTIAASILSTSHSGKAKEQLTAIPKVHQTDLPSPPKRYSELERHQYGALFKEDCLKEISNLEARNCWRIIPISEAEIYPIPLKWVFTYKPDGKGMLERCKSRLVVRGDLQHEDTIQSTYAATLAARSFRVAIAISAHFGLLMKQFDVINAFVNAVRSVNKQPVACFLPDGFKGDRKSCVVIDRALYGLRDSPALWYNEFVSTLRKLNLEISKEEPCLAYDKARRVFVVFFVDDLIVLYHPKNSAIGEDLIRQLNVAYKMREMKACEWFLGVRIYRDLEKGTINLMHDTYIEKIASKFGLQNGVCPSTPMSTTVLVKFEGTAAKADVKLFQSKVGSALYTAIIIRPDIAFAAAQLSHFLLNPSPEHMAAVDWLIRYLYGSRYLSLRYSTKAMETQLRIASDASFADDKESRRSSQGYVIMLFGGPIAWRAARQDTVTTSTTEAELLSLEHTAKESMALARFFKELQLDLGEAMNIFCDNQQTIRLVVGENMRITTKLRHVDIQNMWLRQEYAKGSFQVTYLATKDMPADGLTKNLPRKKFEDFRSMLNLYDARMLVEESS